MHKSSKERMFKIISAILFILSAALFVFIWKAGVFSSQTELQNFIAGFGFAGIFIFILIQAVQVVIPIIPGGVSCLAEVLMYGGWNGFFYNYIGICMGSVIAFLVAKYFGKPILTYFFSQKLIDKYEKWTSEKGRFSKLFTIAIFLPVAPDDFLCYLAGTTDMTLARFITIILLGKPFAIALYSMGLMEIFKHLPGMGV